MHRIEKIDPITAKRELQVCFAERSNEVYLEQLQKHQEDLEETQRLLKKREMLYKSTIQ